MFSVWGWQDGCVRVLLEVSKVRYHLSEEDICKSAVTAPAASSCDLFIFLYTKSCTRVNPEWSSILHPQRCRPHVTPLFTKQQLSDALLPHRLLDQIKWVRGWIIHQALSYLRSAELESLGPSPFSSSAIFTLSMISSGLSVEEHSKLYFISAQRTCCVALEY